LKGQGSQSTSGRMRNPESRETQTSNGYTY
jgi:hypothetical protein